MTMTTVGQPDMALCWPDRCDRNGFGDAINVELDQTWTDSGPYGPVGQMDNPTELKFVVQEMMPACFGVYPLFDPPSYKFQVPMKPNPILQEQLSQVKTDIWTFVIWMLKLVWVPIVIIRPSICAALLDYYCGGYCKRVCFSTKTCIATICCQANATVAVTPGAVTPGASIPPSPSMPGVVLHYGQDQRAIQIMPLPSAPAPAIV